MVVTPRKFDIRTQTTFSVLRDGSCDKKKGKSFREPQVFTVLGAKGGMSDLSGATFQFTKKHLVKCWVMIPNSKIKKKIKKRKYNSNQRYVQASK